ncbi:CTP synthase, partial [bacterium]
LVFKNQGLDRIILRHFGLKPKHTDLKDWQEKVVERVFHPKHKATIAVVGKYIELQDAYKSIYEALRHGGIACDCHVEIKKIDSESIEVDGPEKILSGVSGVLVPGGFGYRGIEGKIKAIRYARENKIPYFGICLGMQTAAIEFARNVLGIKRANSTEFIKYTKEPVISLLEEQRKVKYMGGSMRLGGYPCRIAKSTRAFQAYRKTLVYERHRHRYEFNNRYRSAFLKKGMVFSGIYPKKNLVEIMELKNHPWFVGVQFHPEFQSKPDSAHPLFRDFIKAGINL